MGRITENMTSFGLYSDSLEGEVEAGEDPGRAIWWWVESGCQWVYLRCSRGTMREKHIFLMGGAVMKRLNTCTSWMNEKV